MTVWAKVVGRQLPTRELRVGKWMVAPLRPGQRPPYEGGKVDVNPAPEISRKVMDRMGSREIHTPCYASITLMAVDHSAALEKVEREHFPALLAALSVATGERLYGQVISCQTASGMRYGAWGGGGTFSPFADETMGEGALAEAAEAHAAIIGNAAAGKIARLLDSAWQIDAQGFALPNIVATLLAYFKVIEAITQEVNKVSPPPRGPDRDEARAQIVGALVQQLQSDNIEVQAARIDEAATDLRRLDAKFLSLRMRHAAAVISLPEAWIARVAAFNTLRNTTLGHAGKEATEEQLAPWRGGEANSETGAPQLALLAFRHYVWWLKESGQAS